MDALITTWIAVGTSALALAVVGAIVLEGSLVSLLQTDNAWVGVVFTPIVAGFVFVGAAIGSWLELKPVGCLIGVGTLCIFAIVLILADYFDDLGEAEQIVTYYGIGLLIGGIFSAPAFFIRRRISRVLLMTIPHLVLVGCFIAFLLLSA